MEIGRERDGARQGARGARQADREPGAPAPPAEEGSRRRSRTSSATSAARRSRKPRPAREIDWSAMIEKEPITVILSQRGWIRAMKGHLALEQVADLKWREGDGPFIHFHAQTTDRLALFASNGRVYTLGRRQAAERPRLRRAGAAVHRPRCRGRHRPAAGRPARHEAAGRVVATARASSPAARRRWPRPARASSWSTSGPARGSRWSGRSPRSADAVAVVGENRKMLVFPLAELPELARGQGVTLQRYRDGGLSDAIAFPLARRA